MSRLAQSRRPAGTPRRVGRALLKRGHCQHAARVRRIGQPSPALRLRPLLGQHGSSRRAVPGGADGHEERHFVASLSRRAAPGLLEGLSTQARSRRRIDEESRLGADHVPGEGSSLGSTPGGTRPRRPAGRPPAGRTRIAGKRRHHGAWPTRRCRLACGARPARPAGGVRRRTGRSGLAAGGASAVEPEADIPSA